MNINVFKMKKIATAYSNCSCVSCKVRKVDLSQSIFYIFFKRYVLCISFFYILRFWFRNREIRYVKKYRIVTICGLSGTTKRAIIIANILYLSLVVESFFYNHFMITFRAVHHIVFFRFIWK